MDMQEFSARFEEAVLNSDFTYAQIAELLGVSKATVCNYKRGKIKPDLDNFAKICVLLDVSADYLLGFKEI